MSPAHRRLRLALAAVVSLAAATAWAGPLADALSKSQNFKVRLKAATELGKTRDPDGVRALIRALSDESALVRGAAANSLAQLEAREAVAEICPLRGDPDDFAKNAAIRALATFGGDSACNGSRIFVEIEVNGPDERLRGYVENALVQRAAQDSRILLGGRTAQAPEGTNPRDEVAAGRMPGVALTLNLGTSVDRNGGQTLIRCQLGQAVYELRKERILRGSATQKAEIDLGGSSVSEQAINGQLQECVSALVPVVYEGFGDYLKGVK